MNEAPEKTAGASAPLATSTEAPTAASVAGAASTNGSANAVNGTPAAASAASNGHARQQDHGHDHKHSHAGHKHDHAHSHADFEPHVHNEFDISCACGHEHGEEGHSHAGVSLNLQLTFILPVTIAILTLAIVLGRYPNELPLARAMGLLAAAIAGGPIIWSAIKGLSRGQTNVNELVALAIIAAVGMGWLIEAGILALILQVAALIEQVATESARNSTLALQKLAPVHARVRRPTGDAVIAAELLQVGDVLIVGPGERIAADGQIVQGVTSVDESMVTGESMPVDKTTGSTVLAGTINLTGSAEVGVTRVGEHSALGQTILLVRRAQQFQPKIIRAAERFFAFYTPIILGLSGIAWWVSHSPVRMLTMWVVGCPCAMLLASPLAIVVAMTRASRSGIQVKAGPFVEASATVKTVLFDKTGTLTTGQFVVSKIQPADGVAQRDLLRVAATIEDRSSHPLAKAIVAHARLQGIIASEAADVRILDGLGVEGLVDGQPVRAGSVKLLPESVAAVVSGQEYTDHDLPVVPVYIMQGERFLGVLFLTDEIRPEAARAIRRLRGLGIKRIAMMTGDRRHTADLVAKAVGCDDVYAELLPSQKVALVRQLQRGGKGVAMVGDGINDAPSLAAATVGIAMGLRGTDAAIQAADAVLLKDDLTRVPLLIYLSRQTRLAIYQNLTFGVIFAGLAELAAAFGLFGPLVAALIHLFAVLVMAVNSVRLAGSGGRRAMHTAATGAPGGGAGPALPMNGTGLALPALPALQPA